MSMILISYLNISFWHIKYEFDAKTPILMNIVVAFPSSILLKLTFTSLKLNN